MTTRSTPPSTQLARRANDVTIASYAPGGHEASVDVDPRRLASLLWQRRWHVIGVALLVVVPAMIATVLAEPLYRGTTLIEVSPEPVRVLPYQDLSLGVSGANFLLHMTTQEEILRGPALAARVTDRLRSHADPAIAAEGPRLEGHKSVEQVPNSQLFRISYLAPAADVAAHVSNTIAEEYIKDRFEGRQRTRTEALEMLERELDELEQRVQLSERELIEYVQTNNMYATESGEGDLAQEKLAILSRQLIDAEAEVGRARARVGMLLSASPDELTKSLATPVIEESTARLLQSERELTGLRSTFGENWPAVVQKREEIALAREQLSREKLAVLGQARQQAILDRSEAESRRDMLAAAKSDQEALVADLQDASVEYNIIRREVETNQNLYEGMLERLKETGIASGMELGNIHIVEPALPAGQVASPNVLWNLLLSSVLGLALGLCFVLGRDFWSDTMSTVADVEQTTVLPVLAPIPLVKDSRRRRLGGGDSQNDQRSSLTLAATAPSVRSRRTDVGSDPAGGEAIRSLCASILLSRSDHPPRVITVTSAAPGEGKTTVAVELGKAVAQTGALTLLVECDLRRPQFDTLFGINGKGGLSLFLAGHVEQPEIHSTDEPALFVVGAGPTPPNPVALLNSQRLSTFLHETASEYAFVIVDTPPATPMADARVVGARSDGALLVVRAGQTTKTLLRRVQSVLEHSGVTLLGTVLNGTDGHDVEDGYYDYYRQNDPRA